MKKQILLFLLILFAIFCKGQNEDKKWSFGTRVSSFIAHPIVDKNYNPYYTIIDETSNIGVSIDFFVNRLLNDRLNLFLGFGFEKEKYDFTLRYYTFPNQNYEIDMISMRFPDVGLSYNLLSLSNGTSMNARLGTTLIQGRIFTKYKINPSDPYMLNEDYLINHFFPYLSAEFQLPGKIQFAFFFKCNYNPLPDKHFRRNINFINKSFYQERYRFSIGLELKI